LADLLHLLIDEHPAGWSTINGANLSLTPVYMELGKKSDLADGERPAECYCHGDRSEEAQPITETDDMGMEWAYIFDEEAGTMAVLERIAEGRHGTGFFGVGPLSVRWTIRAVLPLDGPEPDWAELDEPGGES
jgi:hypothetical protein